MNIEHYEFGKITIDGISYFSDIIIYPDHIEDEWWREKDMSYTQLILWR